MAANLVGVQPLGLQEKIKNSKILVVGAGGIGCEVLKNLVLSGFMDITIVDMDTIDLSNLNRQFLFQNEHVGKSKAQVARDAALKFNPDCKITANHANVMSSEYGVNSFKKYDLVLNALDNRAARNHINRLCLNSGVPLIESGTAGYNGQVELIKRELTQCYECTPKAAQKSYPGCTIRNTPSEPVHCIVWAKHLFNQLFGETEEDDDISPDLADPEAQTVGGDNDIGDGDVVRINTRQWAQNVKYDAEALFNKFFYEDIKYLLSMANLWKSRARPDPMEWKDLEFAKDKTGEDIRRQNYTVWEAADCAAVFAHSLKKLCTQAQDGEPLVWDKDDEPAMDFVAACANIRSYVFGIEPKSRFEVKSIAGNIIPAIATTNAITAGMVVMHAFRVLQNQFEKCKTVYIRSHPNVRRKILVCECVLIPPNPKCYVCSVEPAINLRVDTKQVTIKDFRDDILIKSLNMIGPDVTVDAKGIIVISSDEDETKCNEDKLLADMDIVDGVILKCDDFAQNYELTIVIEHFDAEYDSPLFEVNTDNINMNTPQTSSDGSGNGDSVDDGPSTSKKARLDEVADDDDSDDMMLIEDEPTADDANASTEVTKAANKLQVLSTEDEKKKTAVKRKPSAVVISDNDNNDDANVVLDSADEDGPTKCKRTRTSEPSSEVIDID